MRGQCACPLLAESLMDAPFSPLEPLVQGQRLGTAQAEDTSYFVIKFRRAANITPVTA